MRGPAAVPSTSPKSADSEDAMDVHQPTTTATPSMAQPKYHKNTLGFTQKSREN